MRHSLAKFIFILVLVKIDRLDSKPVQVVYTGDGCECPKNLPYNIHIPVIPEPEPVEFVYGYTVDTPLPAKPKYAYSFDFIVDEPIVTTPAPIPSANLFAVVDKVVMPKPDCVLEKAAPCGIPALEELPPPPPPPPVLPNFKACKYDPTKPCTCGIKLDVPVVVAKSCACGQCNPLKPAVCRYVSNSIPNRISKLGGRSKRDITPRKYPIIEYFKAQKAARDAKALEARDAQGEAKPEKSKIVKRDIKGEYDLLEKDQAALDLTLPEIIQYMPETLMPTFKRGKCNIGCKNCIKKRRKTQKSVQKTVINETKPAQQQLPIATTLEYPQTLPNQQFPSSQQFAGASYLKRSVNPYQYPCPCYPATVSPSYIPSQMHSTSLAQNPSNPIWIQPQSLTNPNEQYVYDRLGHKYEVNNGSLKLVTPPISDEVNVSAPATPAIAGNVEVNIQAGTLADQPVLGDPQQLTQQAENAETTIVGAPIAHPANPNHDPEMDKVIRDIIYQHPDFINAGAHVPGSLTQPQNVQRDETMQFLGKLIRGRLDNWFGINEHAPSQQLDDMNRYSRETGATLKFIPVVTVDKDKLDKYRLDQMQTAT